MYRLIISDFDGTLRRSDGTVGENTLEAIRAFLRRGGVFAICTGRMTASILPIARELKLPGLAVSFQGGTISEIETGKRIFEAPFAREDAISITRKLEELGHHVHIYTEDEFYCNVDDPYLHMYEDIVGVKGKIEPCLHRFISESGRKILKIIAMVRTEDKLPVYQQFCELFGERFYVTYSAANLVEITPKGQDKGTALRFLAEYYGIDPKDSIALGDNWNDAPMLEVAGLGVAVENAAEELKRVADLVTASNDEDGVGQIVRKYGLGEIQ